MDHWTHRAVERPPGIEPGFSPSIISVVRAAVQPRPGRWCVGPLSGPVVAVSRAAASQVGPDTVLRSLPVAIPKDQRAQLEREQARIQKAIDRLMDQIELGQSVKDRLKLREEELAQVKDRLAQADVPEFDREALADSMRPYGPLVGLGNADPVAVRQILRKIGVTARGHSGRKRMEVRGPGGLQRSCTPKDSRGAPQAPRARRRPGVAVAPLDPASRSRGPRRAAGASQGPSHDDRDALSSEG